MKEQALTCAITTPPSRLSIENWVFYLIYNFTKKNRKWHVRLQAWPASTLLEKVDFASAHGLVQLPPTVYGDCSERLWLYARPILVVWENCPEGQRTRLPFNHWSFFPPPFCLRLRYGLTTAAKHEYNAQIWHYRRGGNLTIFDKNDDTAEREQLWSSYSQTWAFASISTVIFSNSRLVATNCTCTW